MRGSKSLLLSAIVAGLISSILTLPARAVDFPGPSPGEAKARIDGERIVLENAVLSATWQVKEKDFRLVELADRLAGTTLRLSAPLRVYPDAPSEGPSTVPGAEGKPIRERLPANPVAVRAAERTAGWRVTVPLAWPTLDGQLRAQWRVTLRDQANCVRQELIYRAEGKAVPKRTFALLDFPAHGAAQCGEVDGSPVLVGNMFFACEHPTARNQAPQGKHVTCWTKTFRGLGPGESCPRSAVFGVAPPGQLRRAFLYYLERERPRPYQPFLHYNSWYDIAWGDRKMDEKQCLAAIDLYARELIDNRKGRLDALVFDDGWDDNRTLWRFHAGFPRGFTPLTEAAARRGTSIGVWLSPWGGYGQARDERVKYGKTQGFEINSRGFSLAGPNYYARFREVCAEMVEKYKVSYFKFDGIAAGLGSTGASAETAPDVEGLLRLVADLRKLRPDLFVNVTTGTWPSPFWLLWGDSVWRNGDDMGFAGPGSHRQQWITYRDLNTYKWIVRRAPLYPLNSLMNQGICHARLGNASKLGTDLKEWADEVRSFFGTGTQLQELYVTPQLLTPAMWDVLAEGAAWSRKNADVLADVHWIGGDPEKQEVYGYAAWSPRLGILTLRNPGTKPASLAVDVARAFELPPDAAKEYRLASPWKDRPQPERLVRAGRPEQFQLAPFEVLMLEAAPIR